MALFFRKLVVALLCVPTYPLVLFVMWHEKETSYGSKFSIREASVEYWRDVKEELTYRRE